MFAVPPSQSQSQHLTQSGSDLNGTRQQRMSPYFNEPNEAKTFTQMDSGQNKASGYEFKTATYAQSNPFSNSKVALDSQTEFKPKEYPWNNYLKEKSSSDYKLQPQKITSTSFPDIKKSESIEERPFSHETYFNLYAKEKTVQSSQSLLDNAFLKEKPKSSGIYMQTYYESAVEPVKTENVQQTSSFSYLPEKTQRQQEIEKYKKKVSELTKQLTRSSVDKSDLIVEVAELTRTNHTLRKQIQQLKEEKERQISAALEVQKENAKGIFVDMEIIREIEDIKNREQEIGKIKKEFMQVLEGLYQDETKRLADLNGALKLQLHNARYQLSLANEQVKEKQLKLQLVQKQMKAQQTFSSNQNKTMRQKVEMHLNEQNKQIETLKQSLFSIETQYKAQKKQIADKDDFIKKYMAGHAGQDSEAIELLIEKYNFYSRKQFQAQVQGSK